MATVMINRKNTSAVLHFTANATMNVVGNSTTSSIAYPGETVKGVSLVQAICGSASGNGAYWNIKRGNDLVAVLDSTAQIDFAGCGMPITLYPDRNITVELVGGTDGMLILEVQKLNSDLSYLKEP